MDYRIDLKLAAHFTPLEYGFDEGAQDFLALLRTLEKRPGFNLGWSIKDFRLWEDQDAYIDDQRDKQTQIDPDGNSFFLDIIDGSYPEKVYYSLQLMWGHVTSMLSVEFLRPHPRFGVQTQNLVNLIDVVTKWKRPQHLAFGPVQYLMDHHPVSRQRLGIRWMGWIPFNLTPSDVSEAELVRPMNGGTLIVTQSRFWQAHPNHRDYSKDAIQRAQTVELKLNSLGVLPSGDEINRGDWGRIR